MNALLIIDMQEFFTASKKQRTINECVKLIQEAKKKRQHIILVEYTSFGNTLSQLTNMLSKYGKLHKIEKATDDGGDNVHRYILKEKLNISSFTVCGVNSDACVRETSERLAELGYNIVIVKSACNTTLHWCGKNWSLYRKLKNIKKI